MPPQPGQLGIFCPPVDLWGRLLGTEQLRLRKSNLDIPQLLGRAVNVLAEASQGLTREQLADQMRISRTQLQRLLPRWQRWMNLDGQALLRADESLVRLSPNISRALSP